LHDAVRWGIKHAPWLNRAVLWADDLMGYHKQADSENFWSEDLKLFP